MLAHEAHPPSGVEVVLRQSSSSSSTPAHAAAAAAEPREDVQVMLTKQAQARGADVLVLTFQRDAEQQQPTGKPAAPRASAATEPAAAGADDLPDQAIAQEPCTHPAPHAAAPTPAGLPPKQHQHRRTPSGSSAFAAAWPASNAPTNGNSVGSSRQASPGAQLWGAPPAPLPAAAGHPVYHTPHAGTLVVHSMHRPTSCSELAGMLSPRGGHQPRPAPQQLLQPRASATAHLHATHLGGHPPAGLPAGPRHAPRRSLCDRHLYAAQQQQQQHYQHQHHHATAAGGVHKWAHANPSHASHLQHNAHAGHHHVVAAAPQWDADATPPKPCLSTPAPLPGAHAAPAPDHANGTPPHVGKPQQTPSTAEPTPEPSTPPAPRHPPQLTEQHPEQADPDGTPPPAPYSRTASCASLASTSPAPPQPPHPSALRRTHSSKLHPPPAAAAAALHDAATPLTRGASHDAVGMHFGAAVAEVPLPPPAHGLVLLPPLLPAYHVVAGDGVVSLCPGATEVLAAMGLQGRLVGVTDACDWPPQLLRNGTVRPSLPLRCLLAPLRAPAASHARSTWSLGAHCRCPWCATTAPRFWARRPAAGPPSRRPSSHTITTTITTTTTTTHRPTHSAPLKPAGSW